MLDPVMVEAYGAQMPLNQVATVSVPEPRLISVNVWDRSLVHAVEKAIVNSNLGLSPATEGQTLRLRIPELNEERRKELVKVAHKYAETARVAVRHVRRDGLDVVKKQEKDHKISKDDHDRFSADIQKATDAEITEIDHMLAAQGKGDPHRLRVARQCPRLSSAERASRIRSAAPCRHHHGRQWALGGGARPAARRGTSARRRGACAAPSAPPATSAFSSSPFSPSARKTGRVRPPRSRELMGLLRRFIRNDLADLHKSGVRVRIIGERVGLDPDIGRLLIEAEELTKNNDGLTLVVAFNYGARQEIARAARRIAEDGGAGTPRAGRRRRWRRSAVFSTRPMCPIPI